MSALSRKLANDPWVTDKPTANEIAAEQCSIPVDHSCRKEA
jgi:hypothetical protein